MKKLEAVPIPTLKEAVSRLSQLPEDIRLIQEREGIGLTQLARSLRVSKGAVWHWRKGDRTPREPLILLALLTWADKLRDGSKL